MSENNREKQIADHIQRDPFAAMLNAAIDILGPGHSRVSATVTESMCNFNGTIHGGIIFTIGDMAFAAASNSHGRTAVAMNVNINFIRAAKPGDHLVAEAIEQHRGGRTALYDITVQEGSSGELIARSQGRVYRMDEWFVPPAETAD
ncbi:MAG: hotdog fold thioesterase [bacterium]